MDIRLDPVEVRVLGSLIEKQIATPEYYPLSLNALVDACNQLTNREPVVSYDEQTVARALEGLREKRLVWVYSAAGGRVPKYEQRLTRQLALSEPGAAALCVLMLRGPQTPGEIRGRAGRLHGFQSLEDVEAALQALVAADPRPLAVRLPRQPGTKEARYAHLLGGEVVLEERPPAPTPDPAVLEAQAEHARLARLEEQVDAIRRELAELRQQLGDFRKQFE